MRIASAEITNFRCIGHLVVQFDHVTTFIGPNGVGKSTVLRALDWFFNGGNLSQHDIYKGASSDDQRIEVRVSFDQLTEADREALGPKYVPADASSFTAWRTWLDGADKFTGKAKAFQPFEEVRKAESATAKKAAWTSLIGKYSELALPRWSNQATIALTMDQWERENPDQLADAEVSDTHFFGFRGNRKLSGLFDFVLVTADLRASEESADSKSAIIGRLLDLVVDRTAADEAMQMLIDELIERQEGIADEHLREQLEQAESSISHEMNAFAAGRSIRLTADVAPSRIQSTRIGVSVLDDAVETSVDRQGHGLQRTLLIATLRLLAARGAVHPTDSTVVLAIEEPELFQHPTQAKLLASTLRDLATGPTSCVQIMYATHSPYFIESRYFDQLRRITRDQQSYGQIPQVHMHQASMETVAARLEGHRAVGTLARRWRQVWLNNLAEAFFANAVVVMEGDDDKAILDGLAARDRLFEADGIAVIAVNGKEGIVIPHAILTELGIPTLCIFDNDSGCAERMRRDGKDDEKIEQGERNVMRVNREMLRYFRLTEEDYPIGLLSKHVAAVSDTLETELINNWSDWDTQREILIEERRGVPGKNADTYFLAALESPIGPSGILVDLVETARGLMGG